MAEAHKEYEKTVEENAADLDELNRAIEEARRQILELEITLEEMIEQAIRDREEKRKSMLEGEVAMQDTILEIIQARYQKEWDMIKEDIERRKEALEEEKGLIDERLNARKKAAEKEDKYAELESLEEQLARIALDPTRGKDAEDLQNKIDDLREEIGWDMAEEAADREKEAIDQQIKSLDEYGEYIDEWYTKLFENPTTLIEEMLEIMAGTDEEILKWLQENDETFKVSTEAKQQQMVETWQETLNQMRGITVTYWDEVNDILAQGEEAAIEFLQAHSAEYATSSEKQKQLLISSWQEAFAAVRRAYLDNYNYYQNNPIVVPVIYSESGGGGTKPETSSVIDDRNSQVRPGGVGNRTEQKHFAEGGLVDFTGPAWVDGTKTRPEAFLDADDTRMMRAMLDAAQ